MEGHSFSVHYTIDTTDPSMSGPVPLPDIVICLEAPWDEKKSRELNISINLLSYMTTLFFPFGGFGPGLYDHQPDLKPTILKEELDKEYSNILIKTGYNTVEFLNAITVSCDQVVAFCNFGDGIAGNISVVHVLNICFQI